MLRVGLTGGLASGKSFVANIFAGELAVPVLNADKVGHEALANEAREEVLRVFGTVERPALAQAVFGNPAKLAQLNAILHPRIFARQEAWFAQHANAPYAIVEAAVLLESGGRQRYEKIILTACTEAQQIQRALARSPHATESEIRQRIARQMPLEEKRKFADYVIDTSGTETWTREQTIRVHTALSALAA